MENNWRPSFKLATALPETAAGMGGSLFSSAPSPTAALSTKAIRTGNFFIAEILPHLGVSGSGMLRAKHVKQQLCIFCAMRSSIGCYPVNPHQSDSAVRHE